VLCSPCIPRMLACWLSSFFELPNPHHTSPDPSHDLTDTSCTPTVVDATLARTECYMLVFLDDILIFSKTVEEHEEAVRWVLKRLCEEGYYANPDKCEFFMKEVSFLGHL